MRSLTFAVLASLASYLLAGCADNSAPLPLGPVSSSARYSVTLAVPGDYATIQEAVDAASDGDVIELGAGELVGDVLVDRPLTVRGAGVGRSVVRGSIELDTFAQGTLITALTLAGSGTGTGVRGGWVTFTVQGCELRGFRYGISCAESSGPVVISSNLISGNVWGFDSYECDGELSNNEIINNTHGGVVLRSFDRVSILHNTVVGNGFSGSAEMGAGGISMGPFGHEVARNNIVVGNRFGMNCQQCEGETSNNDVWGNTEDYAGDASPGAGDLALDPRFVNPAEGDFALRPDSPCIDAATSAGVTADLAGRARPYGAAPDMGAHEYTRALSGLVINEVMANPLDEATGEFVELYNGSGAAIDLAGFRLDDGDAVDAIQAAGAGSVLAAGQYGVVLDQGFAGDYSIPAGALRLTVGDARIGNSISLSDPLRLLTADGVTLVSTYSHPFDPGNGVSAERVATDAPDAAGSWLPSSCGASPGAANCVAQGPGPVSVTLLITEVMANPEDEATGEFVEVLNLGAVAVDMAGLILSDGDSDDVLEGYLGGATSVPAGGYAVILDSGYAGQYSIPGAAVLLTVGNATLGNALSTNDPINLRDASGELLATYSYPFDPGNGRSAELVDLDAGDVNDNWVGAPCSTAPYASPGAPNCASYGSGSAADVTLVINEVMANALDEDTGEFVELYNYGVGPVDTAGLLFDDGDASDALLPMAGQQSAIPAGGYAVILDPEYAGEYSIPPGAVLLRPTDTTLGSGLATTDELTLKASDGVTVISTFHHPFNPGNGVSAERVDDSGDLPSNWVASPCAAGSSPGQGNCASASESPPVDTPDLIINEVLANPLDEASQEFIELLNVGAAPVDVAGFILSDGDAIDAIEAWGVGTTTIPAGGFGIVLDRSYFDGLGDLGAALRLTVDDNTICSGLATNDPITLFMPDGVTVVATFSSPFNPGNGVSVERVDPAAPDLASNWVASPCQGALQSSPGLTNCAAGGSLPPAGQLVDVNTAQASELEQISGIGPATAGSIVSYRTAHGAFEDLEQLTAISGITRSTLAGWQQLEAGETHYLGMDPAAARPVIIFESVSELLAALPDPFSPGEWEGRVVRVTRAANTTMGDTGTSRQFLFGDWGDDAHFEPDTDTTIVVYLGSATRGALAVIDALVDWDKEDGAPSARDNFYTWASPTSSGGRIRGNHVFSVEGELQVYGDEWQIYIRPDAEPGMDRLVLFEKWLEADQWQELITVWSYSYKPAVVDAGAYSMTLPYRLTLAHPCVGYWERQTGSAPPVPRRVSEPIPNAWAEYNQALTAWHSAPTAPRLVINEVMYDQDIIVDTAGEMVELYNPNPDPVDLSGWRIEDAGGGHDFPAQGPVVPAWGYLVLGNDGAARINGIPFIDYDYGSVISLHNTSDTLRLLDDQGALVDEVTYNEGAPWPTGAAGVSLELVDPCSDNSAGTLWRSCAQDFSGMGHTFMTPGAANSVIESTCPTQPPPPDPEPACTATQHTDCQGGGCASFPSCVDQAIAAASVYTQQVAASGGADSWSCAEPTFLGAQHTDSGGQLCSFDLACVVILDAEAGFSGQTICEFEPSSCLQLACRFAI